MEDDAVNFKLTFLWSHYKEMEINDMIFNRGIFDVHNKAKHATSSQTPNRSEELYLQRHRAHTYPDFVSFHLSGSY